ncbi:MAG: ppsA [Ferruginibacter sp.]|nr:ppsA [Ferruginibacter sp.]
MGEMFSRLLLKGIAVPDGFATTAFAFEDFLTHNSLHAHLYNLVQRLDKKTFRTSKKLVQRKLPIR